MKNNIGWILYLSGFIGAAAIGLLESVNMIPTWNWVPYVLIVIGLAIGFLNITNTEAVPVMVAALVLGAATGILAVLPAVGPVLEAILMKIAFLSIPIAIPVGVRTMLDKGK